MEISPIRFKKFLDKLPSFGFEPGDFEIKNQVENCQYLEFKNKLVNDSVYSWKRCSMINRIIVIPSYEAITDLQNYKEPNEDISESKALKYFDEWLECLKVKIGIMKNIKTASNTRVHLSNHSILLNWLPNNINTLFQLIIEAGLNQDDFEQTDERWGGDNITMEENQRRALVLSWKKNPQFKFVWHEANRRTQTYFEPMENAAFRYRKNYSLHDNASLAVLKEVNFEFNMWLAELKKRLNEEKIIAERMSVANKKLIGIPASKAKSPSLPEKDLSNELIDWDFKEKKI